MSRAARRTAIVAVLMLTPLAATGARAVQPDELLKDPVLERQAREISAELRCLVCQNQSIDDSDAPLARDLRLLVRERLQAGDSRANVIEFVVARYGEFILLRPRFSAKTYLLWMAPVLLLGSGLLMTYRLFRRDGQTGETARDAKLSDDEQTALRDILRPAQD